MKLPWPEHSLDMQAETPGGPAVKHQSPRTKALTAKKQPGWSALTAEERGIARPVLHYAPAARRAAELSDSHAFPALSLEQLSYPQHAAFGAADKSLWRSSKKSHARDDIDHTEGSSHGQTLDGTQSVKSMAPPLENSLKAEDIFSTKQWRAEGASGADTIQSLRVLHLWADTALLQVVPH